MPCQPRVSLGAAVTSMPTARTLHGVAAAGLEPSSGVIAFGAFRLDSAAGQLLRGAQAIPLRPKTWAVLHYLADRPGVLVSKEELLDRLWPDVAVTPDTLNKSIGELRAALGDDSRAPRVIETVHRRGFRFIAATRSVAARELGAGGRMIVVAGEVDADRSGSPRPFVGREPELQHLAARLASARAGDRQIVFVEGPAGVGKTALVDAFVRSPVVDDDGAVIVARAECSERHGPQEAYAPIFEALEQLGRRQHPEPLVQVMRRTAPLWLAQMPWLLDEAALASLRQALVGARPERMPRELAAFLEAVTVERPLVLVLEDLHWSDPATVDLLAMLAQRREPARLMIIGTYRPAEVAAGDHPLGTILARLRARRQCTALALQDVDVAAVAAYLDRRFPGHEFPAGLARRIHAHTGGQPLFLVATVDHLVRHGWILETAPGWQLSMAPERMDLGVPDDVRRMIETQLHELSPTDRGMLEAASVAGGAVAATILATALRRKVGVASRHCEALARARRFLRAAGTIEWPNGRVSRRYAFTHELYRQVVYEETPEERRAVLHRRIGAALARAYGEQAAQVAPELVVHFERGRDPENAVRSLIAAGDRARQRFAGREAAGYLERALDLIAQLPGEAERRHAEAGARLVLGRALSDVFGFAAEPVRVNYERVSTLCAAMDDAAGSFEALYARWYLHALRAEADASAALAAELADVATDLGAPGYLQLADSVLVRTAFFRGDFRDTSRHRASLRARLLAPGDAQMPIAFGVDPVVAATVYHAAALWFLGDAAGAEVEAAASVARARALGNPFFLSAALAQAALVMLFGRRHDAGATLAAEAVALAGAEGFALWRGLSEAMRAVARLQNGEMRDGIRDLRAALTALHVTGTTCISAYLHAELAEGELRAGAVANGLDTIQAGLALTANSLQCGVEPELWRVKGDLLLARPGGGRRRAASAVIDPSRVEAERCLVRAVEAARGTEARSLELRATTSLARAWQSGGRRAEAREVLGAICARWDAAVTTPDLDEARALLGQLAAT